MGNDIDMATTTITKTQTRSYPATRTSTGTRARVQCRKSEVKVKDKAVNDTDNTRTLSLIRTPSSFTKQQKLERRRKVSGVTIPTAYVVRGSTASVASEPSTSGPSGSGSGSKHTSTETSDRSRSSKGSGRKSSSSSPEVELVDDVKDRERRTRFFLRKEGTIKDKNGKRPRRLSLEKLPMGLSGYQAVRGSLTSNQGRKSPAHEVLPESTDDLIELPQDGFSFASIPLIEAPLPPLRRRSEDRPSPQTLRQARMKQLSQTIHEIDDELGAPPLPRDHNCPPMLRSHHDAPKTPYNSREPYARSAATGAPDGDSQPPSPGRAHRAKRRANVRIRLASLAIDRIVNLADRGYVVDILPSVAVLNLPLDTRTRQIIKRYLSRDRGTTVTGFGSWQSYHSSGSGSTFEQWCYVSRLNMADIGLDGRRRSNNDAGSNGTKDEQHSVVLVPLTAGMAEELRDGLYGKTKQGRTILDSEIA